MKKIFLLLLAQLSATAFAGELLHSAKRNPHEAFKEAENRYWERVTHDSAAPVRREGSAVTVKKKFSDLNFENVANYEYADEMFFDLRDERFLSLTAKPQFARRLSWLYPQDGCWIRAALMKKLSKEWDQVAPHKLFIFGNLKVNTKNAPGGSVSWWYHVVPILRDEEGNVLVLDPAIESKGPMPVKEWITTMVPKVEDAQFSICAPDAYSPSSQCENPTGDEDKSAPQQIEQYLNAEWSNLVSLKRDPEAELGETPPWSVKPSYKP